MESGISMAREAGMDWIIHVDTDELMYPAGCREFSIRKFLSGVPGDVDIVVFPNYESAMERDDVQEPFTEVTMFKKNLDHLPLETYYSYYSEANHGNTDYFLAYGNGKSAARVRDHLRPNGAHEWHNYEKIPKVVKSEEAAILHYPYSKFSDLFSRRDRCNCKLTREDIERCFMLDFDRNAFVIASTETKEEMLRWYRKHVDGEGSELKTVQGRNIDSNLYSQVMAAVLVHNAKTESRAPPETLRFNYFTAGSGGTGPGVLATSFFLMADEAVTYHKGEIKKFKPYSGMLRTDFGEGIGNKEVFLMNVPEVASAHEVLGVPNISARFGTAPFFWNWTLSAMIKLLPTEFLKDKNIVKGLVQLSYPMICAVDIISGQAASKKVDLQCSAGYNTSAIFTHKILSEAVGTATAAFVIAVLEGSTRPGVWYLEERTASSSSLASSEANPSETKVEASFIDFDSVPEPPTVPQTQQVATVASSVQSTTSSSNDWANFD